MANFEELKSQIRESIRENDNGEITGNIMQETLIRMVDDINTSKQDAVAGKGLSTNDFTDADKAKLGAAITEAPADGKLYGRSNGEWDAIGLWSNLTIALTLPAGLSPSDVSIVIRFLDETLSLPYYNGFAFTKIPAGETIKVNIIAPNGYSVPAPIVYAAIYNGTQGVTGVVEALESGLYIYDKFKQSIKSADWTAAGISADEAAGVRAKTSTYDFVVAIRAADAFDKNGKVVNDASAYNFEMMGIDILNNPPYLTFASLADAPLQDLTSNIPKIIQYQDDNYDGWRNDGATLSGFIAAAAAAKYRPCVGDEIGDWILPDARLLYIANQDVSLNDLLYNLGGFRLSTGGGSLGTITCIPSSENNTQFMIAQRGNANGLARFISTWRYNSYKVIAFKLLQ